MSTTATTSKPKHDMPAPSPEPQATAAVAKRLVDLCQANNGRQAIVDLYADNARHVESMEGPGCPRITEGKRALLERADHWKKITTVHSSNVSRPIVNGDQFVCQFSLDCTHSEGPMAGQRMQLSETALYTVKNGKITEGKFFYGCGE